MATAPVTPAFELHLVHYALHSGYPRGDLLCPIEFLRTPDVTTEVGHTAIDAYVHMTIKVGRIGVQSQRNPLRDQVVRLSLLGRLRWRCRTGADQRDCDLQRGNRHAPFGCRWHPGQ